MKLAFVMLISHWKTLEELQDNGFVDSEYCGHCRMCFRTENEGGNANTVNETSTLKGTNLFKRTN